MGPDGSVVLCFIFSQLVPALPLANTSDSYQTFNLQLLNLF